MTKMTYVDALNTALTFVDGEVAEKLTALRDQLVKRNSADHKPTKTQQENVETKEQIYAVLALAGKPMTITEMQEADAEVLGTLSNQKVSALVAQLVKDGKVAKTVEKRKSYFSAVAQG